MKNTELLNNVYYIHALPVEYNNGYNSCFLTKEKRMQVSKEMVNVIMGACARSVPVRGTEMRFA